MSLARAFLLLSMSLPLVSCMYSQERTHADSLLAAGKLEEARSAFHGLVVSKGKDEDRSLLVEIERELARRRFEAAQSLLDRGLPEHAYRHLVEAQLLDDTQVAAREQAHRILSACSVESSWEAEFRVAVDEERWEAALLLLAVECDDWIPRCCHGRGLELLELTWETLSAEFHGAMDANEVGSMREVMTRAQHIVNLHPVLVTLAADDYEQRLLDWSVALGRSERARQLLREGLELRSQHSQLEAYERLFEAAFLAPTSDKVRRELHRQQDYLADAMRARFEISVQDRNWKRAFRATQTLEQLGQAEPNTYSLPFNEVRRRATEDLITEADSFEQRGYCGNALLAVLDASITSNNSQSFSERVFNLRSQVLKAPLCEVLESEATSARGGLSATVLVRRGEVSYSEAPRTHLQRVDREQARVGLEWQDNPDYIIEEQRLRAEQAHVERLHEDWKAADGLSRKHAHRRYRMALEVLERTQERVEELPRRRRRSNWQSREVMVDMLEVVATLELPLWIQRGRDEIQPHRIVAEMRMDGAGPPAIEALTAECEERLAALVSQLQHDEIDRLVPSATELFTAGRLAEGVELAVRALLESTRRDTREEAVMLLRRWTQRSAAAIQAVAPR